MSTCRKIRIVTSPHTRNMIANDKYNIQLHVLIIIDMQGIRYTIVFSKVITVCVFMKRIRTVLSNCGSRPNFGSRRHSVRSRDNFRIEKSILYCLNISYFKFLSTRMKQKGVLYETYVVLLLLGVFLNCNMII